jgi:hypothetical protein
VQTGGYDKNTGLYTPPGSATGVPMWSTKQGLTSEYGHIKDVSGNYHVYGSNAYAQITPAATNLTAYDYKFLYPDGSYYYGKVVDDGTFGYKPGATYHEGIGTYTITGVDPFKPDATALAGYNYTTSYVDSAGTPYSAWDTVTTSPYFGKPTGYGGLSSEADYIQKPTGYLTDPLISPLRVPTRKPLHWPLLN